MEQTALDMQWAGHIADTVSDGVGKLPTHSTQTNLFGLLSTFLIGTVLGRPIAQLWISDFAVLALVPRDRRTDGKWAKVIAKAVETNVSKRWRRSTLACTCARLRPIYSTRRRISILVLARGPPCSAARTGRVLGI